MGGATRSQMDIRLCLRVRERRDTDLILGQGMAKLGWHAERLSLPGTFLLSAPEHHAPDRARAFLVEDDAVTRQSARHAARRPTLPGMAPVPATGTGGAETAAQPPAGPAQPDGPQEAPGDPQGPDAALWDALSHAGPQGATVGALMTACGRGRRWVYYRLREHAREGRAEQLGRGHWRAVPGGGGQPPSPPGARPRGPRGPKSGRPPGRNGK
jgi:S-DNA-T family DNA segregation ATPase FtsK/SpoIIIE